MRIFLDSSALAKRYVTEPGTEQVLRLCEKADEVVLSALCVPELISGFNRLRREGVISSKAYRSLKRDFAADVEAATIVDLDASVIDRAIFCLERASLRALDALQLASAMQAMCDVFVTADQRQREAARRFRLHAEAIIGSH